MRRGLIACALVVAALSTAACGGGAANALQSVANAASKTAGVESEKVHIDVVETAGPLGSLHIPIDGVVDNKTKSVDLTVDLSTIASLAGGKAGNADQWKAHEILDNSGSSPVMYMQLPALDQYLNGKTWLKADLGELSQTSGIDLKQLFEQAANEDPTKTLQLLQSVGNVSKVGTATIGGVETTEYKGTVDVKKAAASLGGSFEKLLDEANVSTVPVDVWIGNDGLIRRFHETLSLAVNGTQTTMDLTADISGFGTPVTITPPPADQVVDISQLKGAHA